MNGRKISFDGWVLDRESGDLTRDGNRQRLQELPLKVLELLLASPGGLVTREQLIAHLWPKGVVDFDMGLNTAVRKLRMALGDVADAPRYIETIPRRGYRFVGAIDPAPIEEPASPEEKPPAEGREASVPSVALQEPVREVGHVSNSRRGLIVGIAATAVVCVGGLYWLSHRAVSPPVAASSAPVLALPDRSVAVLPFESLSTEPNNEFLALGIAETVLHRLAGVRDLTVIARTSSFGFKNRNEDARQIGRALNARYLVQGSVQRGGERLRVQAQLVDAASGKQLWSLAFDRPLADIFVLQDEISTRVAEQLSVSITPGKLPPNDADTPHLDAYLSYLQGRALINTNKIADARLAIQYFARAAEIDPQFAAAYAQESRAISRLEWLEERSEDPDPADVKRAIALNDKALSLNPQLGEAWVQRASLLLATSNDKDAAEAEKDYRNGLELAPNYGQGFEEFADFLSGLGRMDEALTMIERARQVDPLLPRNHYLKGMLLDIAGGEDREVEALYLQALKLNPTYHPALARLGFVYSWEGEYARGLMLHEKALSIEPDATWIRSATAASYLTVGDVAAAEDVLRAGQGRGGEMKICVDMVKGDHAAAVTEAYELYGAGHPDTFVETQQCAAAEIVRDALATRHYDRASRVLESQYAIHAGRREEDSHTAFIWGLPLAQLLLAKGDTVRADRLTKSILATADQEPKNKGLMPLLLYARASALMARGDDEQALVALEKSVHHGAHVLWWIIDRMPAFDRLKHDSRYTALSAAVDEIVRKQAGLVAKMRVAKELPQRPAGIGMTD